MRLACMYQLQCDQSVNVYFSTTVSLISPTCCSQSTNDVLTKRIVIQLIHNFFIVIQIHNICKSMILTEVKKERQRCHLFTVHYVLLICSMGFVN